MDRGQYPAGCRFQALTGERRAGPSQLRPLPLDCQRGGVTARRTLGVFRWASSADHEQVEFRLAQMVTNSRSESGFPFRGLNWTLLWWDFEQRDEADESPESSGQPLVCVVFPFRMY